jgi:catechol 2,3-dioxygenase-like lactoylglutathione lyase family enzyme
MEPRVSLVTLGVDDLARSKAFYDRLGWRGRQIEGTVFYQGPGHVIVLWPRRQLAEDAAVADDPEPSGDTVRRFRGVALAQNVGSPAEVDDILVRATAAGATITKAAATTFYGGYAGYFADPDGHLWEIAHNPGFPLGPDATLRLPADLQPDDAAT